jgi:hypothetical protein
MIGLSQLYWITTGAGLVLVFEALSTIGGIACGFYPGLCIKG